MKGEKGKETGTGLADIVAANMPDNPPTTDVPETTDKRTSGEKNLRQFLEFSVSSRKILMPQTADSPYKYVCLEDYVLQNGETFTSQPLTKEEWEHVLHVAGQSKKFPIKQCFSNSQSLALNDPTRQIKYVEGYCQAAIIPVLHGWCTINGKVIDLTLRLDREEPARYKRRKFANVAIGEFPDSRAYIGKTFTTEEVRKSALERGVWGSLIDDWERGHPLLRVNK